MMPNFRQLAIKPILKIQQFPLSTCWFLGKNLSNFVPPVWKLHNPYCHNMYLSKICIFLKFLVCNEEVIKDNLYQETDNFEGEEEDFEDLTEMETARPMDVKVQGGAGGIAER